MEIVLYILYTCDDWRTNTSMSKEYLTASIESLEEYLSSYIKDNAGEEESSLYDLDSFLSWQSEIVRQGSSYTSLVEQQRVPNLYLETYSIDLDTLTVSGY